MKFKTEKTVYYILMLMPFVDQIVGYALNSKNGGILGYLGQVYRIIVFFYMFYVLYGRKFQKRLCWLLMFTAYAEILAVVNALRFNVSVIENTSYTIKLLFPIYMFYCVVNASQRDGQLIDKVYKAYSWIYPLSFIIPKLLGVGYTLAGYAFESGYKGFYFATNEQNVVIMVLFVYEFQKLYSNLTYSKENLSVVRLDMINILKLLLIVLSLVLIGSKTSFLAIAAVYLVYLLRGDKAKAKLKFIAAFSAVALVLTYFVSNILSSQLGNIANRLAYAYNRFAAGEGGILTFMLSRRNLRVEPAINYWYDTGFEGVINFIFGIGKAAKCPYNGIGADPFALIELDLFDLLFWFGAIATAIVLCFYLSFLWRTAKDKNLFMEKVMFILVFSFSVLAGHVMASVNSGTIFAVVIASMQLKIQSNISSNKNSKFSCHSQRALYER